MGIAWQTRWTKYTATRQLVLPNTFSILKDNQCDDYIKEQSHTNTSRCVHIDKSDCCKLHSHLCIKCVHMLIVRTDEAEASCSIATGWRLDASTCLQHPPDRAFQCINHITPTVVAAWNDRIPNEEAALQSRPNEPMARACLSGQWQLWGYRCRVSEPSVSSNTLIYVTENVMELKRRPLLRQ